MEVSDQQKERIMQDVHQDYSKLGQELSRVTSTNTHIPPYQNLEHADYICQQIKFKLRVLRGYGE